MFDSRVGNSGSFFAFHFEIQESDDRMQEIGTVCSDIIGQPLVQVEILATRGKSSYIQRERERPDFQQRVQYLFIMVSNQIYNIRKRLFHLEILSNI